MPPKPRPTHFLCIPLVTALSRPQLTSSLASFAADVTGPHTHGLPAGAVRPVGTLHLTLGVMSFPRNEGLEKAVDILKTLLPREILASVQPPISAASAGDGQAAAPKPSSPLLSITLKGLHSMQQASKATVLYASPVDEEGNLQRFCEKLKEAFQKEGLMMDDNRPLLLHATILNTVYVKGRRGKNGKRERLTVDARNILDQYDDFCWMEDVPVEKIAICRMGAKEQEDDDQAYEVEADIDIDGSV